MVYNLKHTFLYVLAFIAIIVTSISSYPALVQAQAYDSSSAAAAEIRFQQLEKEIRRLTGMVEEQNYKIRRLRDELAKATGDLGVRINDLEQNNNADVVSLDVASLPSKINSDEIKMPPVLDTKITTKSLGTINKPQPNSSSYSNSDSNLVSSSDSAPRAYDNAYSFIKQRDFENAEKAFAKFISDFPKHNLVSNAKYWYGETFYVRGGYEKAARIFAEGYQQFPKGAKAASNLLKLGMSLTGMGKTDDACIAYKQLKKDYAKSSVPVLKRANTEMKRINCK